MKKMIIASLLFVSAYQLQAQTLTVNNNTTCGITFSAITSDPGTCNAAYTSSSVSIPATNSQNYNYASFPWAGPVPPMGSGMSGIVILDDGQLKFAGDECASLPLTISYPSSCNGNTVNVSWTDNGGGSATVDIN